MIIAITCCGKNWEIGENNGLAFKGLKKDLGFFQHVTTNNNSGGIVVMGEHTFLSLPKQKPLKNRLNIVLCHKGTDYPGCFCVHDFDELVEHVKLLGNITNVYICGGGWMYKKMLPYCDEILVNRVQATNENATVFFPNLYELTDQFQKVSTGELITDGEYTTRLEIYKKV